MLLFGRLLCVAELCDSRVKVFFYFLHRFILRNQKSVLETSENWKFSSRFQNLSTLLVLSQQVACNGFHSFILLCYIGLVKELQ